MTPTAAYTGTKQYIPFLNFVGERKLADNKSIDMKPPITISTLLIILASFTVVAQTDGPQPNVVHITGVRFAYPLVQQWIDRYNKENPELQVIIESRNSSDPAEYEILIEAYEHPEEIKRNREYVYLARYVVLPVANSTSQFADVYGAKGIGNDQIKQLFFHDILADKEKQKVIKIPYTVYTRLQKAGIPSVFANHYGYEQKDIKGKSIAGSDEHLRKALLRDSTAVSYLPLSLIYDLTTGKPVEGISVLPLDLNDNGKVNDDERFYDDLPTVVQRLETLSPRELKNVPLAYLHFSVDRNHAAQEAIAFLRWVIIHGEKDLHEHGYLIPEPGKLETEKFEQFASGRTR